jgi:hypothetical protein
MASLGSWPDTAIQWQDAVDAANACMVIEAAREYGLVCGGPEVDLRRCIQILAAGLERGIRPTPGSPARYFRVWNNAEEKAAEKLGGRSGMNEPLFRACPTCQGTRLAPPDDAIHQSLPEHSTKVVRPARPGRTPCPGCSGLGYLPAHMNVEFLLDRSRRLEQALELLRDFISLCEDSDEVDGASYLSDGLLMGMYVRAQRVVDRDTLAAANEPAHV